jgi:ribose transport system permease protein
MSTELDQKTTADPEATPVVISRTAGDRIAGLSLRFGVVVALVLTVILARVFYSGFLGSANIWDLISENVPVGLVALGMTFVIIAGGFDLSAGSIMSLCAVIYTSASNHMSLPLAALFVIGVGLFAGLINGVLVTRMRITPFIATLGTGSVYGGAAYIYEHSNPISSTRHGFATLGNNDWLGIPIDIYLLAVFVLISGVLLVKTKLGRSMYAIGGNAEASRLCGIRVNGIVSLTYVLTGLAAAVAGIVIASQLGTIYGDIGATTSLQAIEIVVIGGTSLYGGEGAIWRTVIGLLILSALTNVLNAKAIDSNWQNVVLGGVLVAAVSLDVFARRVGRRAG